MYRPAITVLDCSIRDGGLMNDSRFPIEMVRDTFKAISASGVDYCELGYRNNPGLLGSNDYGPWRFCDEDKLREATDGIEPRCKLAIMQDAHKALPEDILPCDESVVDMIRVATYVKDMDKAIRLANNATDKGYEATINVMAISHALDRELDEALAQVEEETSVKACYIVDSFGALYSEDIDFYVEKYQRLLKTKEVGIHCHNHQQLAFANTIQGIIKGVNYLDGTIFGIGRAAGNCPLELLIGFLKNPKFNLRPLLAIISKSYLDLQKELEWGYYLPYMITGILNKHPLPAMEVMKAEDRNDFVKFYETILADVDEV
ncbi:MAG: nucleoid-structuring protein H-NS [Planctomycetes bacterium]|nr:nucleoid-structuring protein H-NS [Planctomycetota bacterium]